MKAWGGRFSAQPDAGAAAFGRSIEIDAELASEDIAGSLAHVDGLQRAGLLSQAEAEQISAGLRSIAADVHDGSIEWDPAHEDIHMNVEMALATRIGPVAGKLHTGRSRNVSPGATAPLITACSTTNNATTPPKMYGIAAKTSGRESAASEYPIAAQPDR